MAQCPKYVYIYIYRPPSKITFGGAGAIYSETGVPLDDLGLNMILPR